MKNDNFRRGNTILSMDNTEIKGVYFGPSCEDGWTVGHQSVVSIHAYDEYGNGSMVPWLAICSEDKVLSRKPAFDCSVVYK